MGLRITSQPQCAADLPTTRSTRLHHQSNKWRGYLTASPHHLNHTSGPTTSTPPTLKECLVAYPQWLVSVLYHGRTCTGTRISTGYPSTTPVGLALGPDSPWEDELDPGTLSHPAGKILTCHSLLMPAFSLACSPPLLPVRLHPTHDAPLPKQKCLPRLRRCA